MISRAALARRNRVMVAAAAWLLYAVAAAAPPAAGTYRIDGAASFVHVLVYRGGLLSRLGHNHVVVLRQPQGSVTLRANPAESEATLRIALDRAELDVPRIRRLYGEAFAGKLDADDIAATRRNMLGTGLLDAERHPQLEIRVLGVGGVWPNLDLRCELRLAGRSRTLEFPVALKSAGSGFSASGERVVTHEELGLAPYTAAFGALRVREEMRIRYRLVAVPADAGG